MDFPVVTIGDMVEAQKRLAEALGMPIDAQRFREEAEALRVRFEDAFWCEELGTYALFAVLCACGHNIRKILAHLRAILAPFIAVILATIWQRPADQTMPEVA